MYNSTGMSSQQDDRCPKLRGWRVVSTDPIHLGQQVGHQPGVVAQRADETRTVTAGVASRRGAVCCGRQTAVDTGSQGMGSQRLRSHVDQRVRGEFRAEADGIFRTGCCTKPTADTARWRELEGKRRAIADIA